MRFIVKVFNSYFPYQHLRQKMHTKCLNDFYPRTEEKVKRTTVPIEKVLWEQEFVDYSPVLYTAPHVLNMPSYADPDTSGKNFTPKWNEIDGNVNRKSHEKKYEIISRKPRNYKGRTGIIGRGCLGRWGPNHAADPIVTRWKLNSNGSNVLNESSMKRILQFVSIQRRDNGQWAFPGGMVDPGEKVTSSLQREFMEEALNSLEMTPADKQKAKEELKELFEGGVEVYSGYVDDPRNTDNAWMETVAYNFHEENSDGILYKLNLNAGDDAQAVKWMDVSKELLLYASHKEILEKVVKRLDAHW